MGAEVSELPLFPLNTVLFPGGPLPLRIFEPRYLDMVSRCLKTNTGFGVVAIRSGSETGPASTFGVGTTADIVNWYQDDDGLLAILTVGRRRFRIRSVARRPDGLYTAAVTLLRAEPPVPLPEAYQRLATFLERAMGEEPSRYRGTDARFDDAGWVGGRLAELLPIELPLKQALLELDDPIDRLERLEPVLDDLESASEE